MHKKQISVAVLGAGNMGTAIAQIIANNGYPVKIWNYEGDPEPLRQIQQSGENKKYLKTVKLSENIIPIFDLEEAVFGANIVFFVVPSAFMRVLVKRASRYLRPAVVCVDVSKGLDEKSLGLVPDIIMTNLPLSTRGLVASISGPAIALDMVKGGFTAMNVASVSKKSARLVRQVLENENLKLVPTTDVIGVELTGSFKNVYAIAIGLCDGLKMAMNAKAALLVVALREISQLVNRMGGKTETVYDLAGLGDLIGTGLAASSRNRRFGEFLVQGFTVKQALHQVCQVVEGINASKALHFLGKKYKIKTPFAEMVYKVATGRADPKFALSNFLKNLS